MADIHVLDSETVDKIAAGEVVERPASVVKELVENAIDAEATAITVDIKQGGIALIRVTDNGSGMEREQIPKAFLRHATSKILKVEDLNHCESLGFRGEALSSIAAVSMVELITKPEQALMGTRFVMEGAVQKDLEEIGAPSGTTIIIRNIFYNTPGRRKFLKTPQTEAGYISELMEQLAMSKPEISFKYIINGQLRFHTSGNGDLKEIIYRIYGKDIVKELLPVEKVEEGLTITGYIGKPVLSRANRQFEHFFVNHRYIHSTLLGKALEEAYKPFFMQHRFPFAILHLEILPEKIDVNVHPTKMEVRFSEEAALYNVVYEEIKRVIAMGDLIPEVTPAGTPASSEKKVLHEKQDTPEPFEANRMQEQGEFSRIFVREVPPPYGTGRVINEAPPPVPSNVIKSKDHILVEKPEQLNFFDEKLLTPAARSEYRILGQIFDTYWLLTYQDKLFFMDQHAAHEKVKYEALLKHIKNHEILTQNVNPPVIVTLSGREEEVVLQVKDSFEAMGFTIEAFGGSEYAIRTVPVDLFGRNEKELFLDILDELLEKNITGAPEIIQEKLASMACKAAVKGNHAMSLEEVNKLLDQLLELENPYHCPHGRPTFISMSKYEIEKKFKRIL